MRLAFFYLLVFLTLIALAFFTYHASQIQFAAPSQGTTAPAPEMSAVEKQGEGLFKSNCASCHKPAQRLVGPALAGIAEKYAADKDYLYAWVRNSQKLINEGEPRAVAIYTEYNEQVMQAFPTLTDEEIDAILAYADYQAANP